MNRKYYLPSAKQIAILTAIGKTGPQIAELLDANYNTVRGTAAKNGIALVGDGNRRRKPIEELVRKKPGKGLSGEAFYANKQERQKARIDPFNLTR